MARPPALKILQSTPTDPSEAGPDNRLCQKCGLFPTEGLTLSQNTDDIEIMFVGNTKEEDRVFLRKTCDKIGVTRLVFRNYILCPVDGVMPVHLHCCRAFLLGEIATTKPRVVVALGDMGLAALRGNASSRVTHTLGREIFIPEIPEQVIFTTYHTEAIRDSTRESRALPKNFQIVRDIKKTQVDVVKKPEMVDKVVTGSPSVFGFDTEFDEEGTYTLALADQTRMVVVDKEQEQNLSIIPDDATLAAHYIQVDLDQLVREQIPCEEWLQGKRIQDTFVLAHFQNENLPQQYHYGVEDVLTRLYRAPDWKKETEVLDPAKPLSWGIEKRVKRCGYDAWASYKIWEHPAVQKLLSESQFVMKCQHRMIPTYHRIKYTGVYVDKTVFDQMHDTTLLTETQYRKSLEPYIREEFAWPEFDLSNNGHIRTLLYGKMKMPLLKKSQSGLPSVDADALENMIAEPMIQDLLTWRKANKLMTTWYGKEAKSNSKPLYERVYWGEGDVGYLPVNLGVGATATGRRQSHAPNMQNWAKESRPIVCSRFGKEGRLIWSDYEKLEVYLLADEIKDEKLKQYFREKGGYLGLARDLMGTSVEKGDDNYRAVKAVALAANYNAKPMSIAGQLYYKANVRFSDDFPQLKWKSVHYYKSQELLETYFHMFPKIKQWFTTVEHELLANQGVRNRFGHFRHLPCPSGVNTPGYKHLLNQAINFKIQSVAGLVTGISAVLIEQALLKYTTITYTEYHHMLLMNYQQLIKGEPVIWKQIPYLCNEVHDELMVDAPQKDVPHVKQLVQHHMTKTVKTLLQTADPTFDAYLGVEQEVGQHWCQPKEDK